MFRFVFLATGLFCIALGALVIMAPRTYLTLYAVSYSPEMDFAAQRLGAGLIGLGGFMGLIRLLPPSPLALRFALMVALVWVVTALTGVLHFVTGVATANILIAAALEVGLAALFVFVGLRHRNAATPS
ncbi:MAG: hypothetical protein AAGL89_09340 [Pseudomonadota bacterium]